jgi:hypothetical protein
VMVVWLHAVTAAQPSEPATIALIERARFMG